VVKRVVDTTGAGDFYAAGFMYGLSCGYSLDKCCRIGSLLASQVIQVIGTTLSRKRWDDIKRGIDEILQN
jgi:sugar/nucleoside kinase (ribokinase family)